MGKKWVAVHGQPGATHAQVMAGIPGPGVAFGSTERITTGGSHEWHWRPSPAYLAKDLYVR